MNTSIEDEIRKVQNLNVPYYPTVSTIRSIHSKIDHFPYTRFFQGNYKSHNVRFFDREAGFRIQNQNCYTPIYKDIPNTKVDLCYQAPASITYPCNRENKEQEMCGFLYRKD